MNETARVLVLEAKAAAYNLAQNEIRTSLGDCTIEQARTRKDFIESLKSFKPDLILADYNLPRFNGIKAVEAVYKHAALTPIIIWAESVSEDIAAACMKAGAYDYVFKEDVRRLGTIVVHALEKRQFLLERKQTQETIHDLSRFPEENPNPIVQVDKDGQIIYANMAGNKWLDEWKTNVGGFLPEELHDSVIESFSGGAKKTIDITVQDMTYSTIIVPIRESGCVNLYAHDITQRKRMELKLQQTSEEILNAEKFLQNVQNALTTSIAILNEQGTIIQVNAAWREFGKQNGLRNPNHGIDMNYLDICDSASGNDSKEAGMVAQMIREVLVGSRDVATVEYPCHSPEEKRWFVLQISRFQNGSQKWAVLAHQNITKRVHAEGMVKDSEERFRALIENGRDNISLLDENGTLLWENPSTTSTLGYRMDEFKGRNIFELMHPDDQFWTRELLVKLIEKPGSRREGLFRLRHSNGTWCWIEGTATNMLDNPSVQAIVINYRDVTERKEADARIRESEERFSKAFNLGPAALSISQVDGGTFLAVNEAFLELYGYKYTEVVGHSFQKLNLFPSEKEAALVTKLLHEQANFRDQEYRIRTKSGDVRTVTSSGESIELGGEKYMLSFTTDITERKQAEMERQALLEIMQGLANTNDLQEFLMHIHALVARALYAENFFVVLYQADTGLFDEIYSVDQYDPPALPSKLEKSITAYVFRTGEPVLMTESLFDELADQGEVELVGTNSTSWLGVPLKTPNGIIGVIGVQDYENSNRYSERDKDFLASIGSQVAVAIERKRAEEELHHSEARFKILFENSPISLWEEDYSQVKVYFDHLRSTGVTDFQDYFDKHPEAVKKCASLVKVLDVNRATLDLMQVEDKSELLGGLSKSLYEDAYPYFKSELISLANGNLSFESDEGIMLKDGSSRQVFFSLSVVSGYAENLGKVLVSILDITERKQAEQDLRLSEERFLQLANNIQEVFWITDAASGEDIYISPASKTIWGRSVETMLHDSNVFLETIQPEDRPAVVRTIEKQRGGENTEIEYRITLPDGSVRWVWDRAFPVFDEEGRVVRLAGIAADITERKQNERETTRHLIELEALYENGLAVSRLLEPAEIGRQVIETFAKHLSWHHATIRLRKNKDDLALIALNKPGLSEAEKNEMVRHFNSMVSQVGEGLSGFVVQTGTPIRSGDVRSHPKYIETQANIQSGLYMPLKIGERVLGVISVESERPDAFSPEDERLLATLANQATIAFENATLYQAARQEIAERLRVENALRTSETHYRDLANSITDIMFEIDENLQFTHWNKSSGLLTGIPEEKALGKTTREIFGDSSEAMEVEKAFLSVLSNRVQRSFESPLRLNGGQYIYEINAYPSTNGISVIAKDVTNRRLSENIMQKRFELMNFSVNNSLESLMQKMLDEITELIPSQIGFFHFMDEDESTPGEQMWSTNVLQLSKVPASEGHHRPLDEAGVWADAVRLRRPLIQNDYKSLSEKKGLPEGHVRITRNLIIPIIRNERIMAVLGIGNKPENYTQQDFEAAIRFADHAWDIIERKNMELTLADERNQLARRIETRTADLSRANSNLARALRVKDEFLANMSHELRTPLNAILGLSESLGEQTAGSLNEKQLKYINTIGESGHHLLSLINDILDLAKIDAGQITLNINKVDIKSICEASLRMVKQLAMKKNQSVELDIDDSVGLMWADERRLKQMLVNLLSNAVKFTPEDGRLGLEVRGDQSSNQVSCTVWDNGIGIKDNDLSLLFQPFIQLDGGLARENAGTGLGLALVSQMARLHGGGVTVESLPKRGSRFTITLPWEPALSPIKVEKLKNTGRLYPPNSEENYKETILLIEDTQEVTMMLRDYLESAGYHVVTAENGLEGINQAKLTHPALILMDIQMPFINGFEATKRLREEPEFEHTPIIALTALAMPNDRERCLAAGMDDYISKPVNLKVLLRIIKSHLLTAKDATKPK